MKIHFNFSALAHELADIETQSITVGVIDKSIKAARADTARPLTTLATGSGATLRNYAKRRGRSDNPPLFYVAGILEKKRGIFSRVLALEDNRALRDVCQQLVKFNKTPADIRRLENAARALVRNPILLRSHGENAPSTQKRKRFDMYGFSTGTLFKHITAHYKKW